MLLSPQLINESLGKWELTGFAEKYFQFFYFLVALFDGRRPFLLEFAGILFSTMARAVGAAVK